MLPIIWLADQPYFVYITFLVGPTYLVWKFLGFDAVLRWYYALWPAIAIYFCYAHGHRFFKGDFAKETLTYGLPLMPVVILLVVVALRKIKIHAVFTLWITILSNLLVSFSYLNDWYLVFLKKLPRNPIPEKVAALFWREDWWLLGVKAVPMLAGAIALLILVCQSIIKINRNVIIPRRQNKKKRMLEKLQKELGVTDVSPQELSPIICKDQEKGLHDIVEADKIGWLGNIVSTEDLNKSTTVAVK
jgi:hypothetical protein